MGYGMGESKCLLDQKLDISEKFRVELKVFEVEVSKKYPEGIKARFVLIDLLKKNPVLLIDNHAPFGFHVHEDIKVGRVKRKKIVEDDYIKVLNLFWNLAREILKNED
jgi:hypothetical protein